MLLNKCACRRKKTSIPFLPSLDNVINLHNHNHSLGGQLGRAREYKKRPYNILFKHITYLSLEMGGLDVLHHMRNTRLYLSHVYASILITSNMCVAEFGYNINWIEASIFSQCVWNNFKSLTICTGTIALLVLG